MAENEDVVQVDKRVAVKGLPENLIDVTLKTAEAFINPKGITRYS